jgi:dihydrofolate reductase
MGKVIQFNMMSVDGLFEGKNKEIDWHNVDSEFNEFAIEQLDSADTLIFGRITYELMANYWPTAMAINDDPLVARKMNTLPKVVFSRTLSKVNWENTSLFHDHPDQVISNLKKSLKNNIFIFGSANLSATLIKYGLIDEYRIIINPIILGEGIPLFSGISERINLNLRKTKIFKSGNVLLHYEPKR